MISRTEDIYVLGTGLSHDGSACLLKNGEICVAIEKERITRIKHDGMNDTDAINYCLKAEGISLNNISLVIQNANSGFFEFGNSHFYGKRLFEESYNIPIVTISHHLAHAYYAIGTSPFQETAVLVMDGCGSLNDECIDMKDAKYLPQNVPNDLMHLFAEKDSFYLYSNNSYKTIYKDFSPWGLLLKGYPMHPNSTQHSIGGLYSAVTEYCFQDNGDAGKLMGLAPYGRPNIHNDNIFELKNDRVFVNYDWMKKFRSPALSSKQFWDNFQYYADIAYWVQKETEKAILYIVQSRRKLINCENLSYSGGVALNAVANAKITELGGFKNYYFTPAAGDNGLAIGCAYYGWLEVLKKKKRVHKNSSCYGKSYDNLQIQNDIENFFTREGSRAFLNIFFENIHKYVNEQYAYGKDYFIRIVISDFKIFNLLITKDGKLDSLPETTKSPDCLLITDTLTFLNSLNDHSYLITSIKNNDSLLKGDIQHFLGIIKVQELFICAGKLASDNKTIARINFAKEEDVIKKAAQLLAAGKVIGWFQGGSEFGPRALGHRSILADPRKVDVRNFINSRVKFREDFRPFAPSVLKEKAPEYFENCIDSPYMLIITQVIEKWRDKIPGVVHTDNTARVQTVTQELDARYYQLVKEFESITGIPILLNTSFNKKGMPIVETPSQALAFFYECDLDCLVIGDYVVYKNRE